VRLGAIISCFAVIGSGALASDVAIESCARTTHISHAGETAHRDLGEGRVLWQNWWAQEGTATDLVVVDCASGNGLRARVAEANMSAERPFDKTNRALSSVELIHDSARVFATFERLETALSRDVRRIERLALTKEPCACAALYPEALGEKMAFEFENLPARAGFLTEGTQ